MKLLLATTLVCSLFGLMYNLQGQEWELVWSDEFETDGAPDSANWDYDLGAGGWGNSEVQTYTNNAENVRVESGELLIQVQQVPVGRTPGYTSARIHTREKQSLKYGKIEVRAKMPSETGTWSAIWMLSTDAILDDVYWPNNGEIDIMEMVGYEEDPLFLELKGESFFNNIHSTLHTESRNHLSSQGIGDSTHLPTASTEYHTYSMEWTEDRLEFFIDGVSFHLAEKSDHVPSRNTPDDISQYWPFDQRFHLILNIAMGGAWGGHFNTNIYPSSPYGTAGIDHDGVWPQTMAVDYVRMYKWSDPADSVPAVPGDLKPQDHVDEYGLIMDRLVSDPEQLVFVEIDAGDSVEYEVISASGGSYELQLEVASAVGGETITVTNLTTEDSFTSSALTATGGTTTYVNQPLGDLTLVRGVNHIKLEFNNSTLNVGTLSVQSDTAGTFKGLAMDTYQVIDSGDFLGKLDVEFYPYAYASDLNGWVYLNDDSSETFNTSNQWIFIPEYEQLYALQSTDSNWSFSRKLNRWILSNSTLTDPSGKWIYLIN